MSAAQDDLLHIIKAAQRRAEDDPAWFFRTVMGFHLLPWQEEGIHAIFDVRRKLRGEPTYVNHEARQRISVRSCHGTGKTQWLAAIMHIWNFTTPGKIACTAPKEAQLLRRLMPRYRKLLSGADEAYKQHIEVLGKDVNCFGSRDWGAAMETATDPDNLSGYHDTPQLFLIDEASARRLDPMFPVIEGALSTPGSVSVEIGNPTRTEGEFYDHHNKASIRNLYYLMHIKAEDAPGLVDPAWVKLMIQKYGVDSPITKIRAFGEFASLDEAVLIPLEYLEDALDQEETPDGSLAYIVISADIGDGTDSTQITVARHYDSYVQVLQQKGFWFNTSEAPIKAANAIRDMWEGFGCSVSNGDYLVVDALGVGAGTAGRLIEQGYPLINYKGGEASDNPSRWRNRRVQTYMSLYEAFRDGKLRFSEGALDDEEEFRAHLFSIKRGDNERVEDIEPKKKIKQAGLPSPDKADSLAMQFANKSPIYSSSFSTPILTGSLETSQDEW